MDSTIGLLRSLAINEESKIAVSQGGDERSKDANPSALPDQYAICILSCVSMAQASFPDGCRSRPLRHTGEMFQSVLELPAYGL
jgi:hypothetical protein